MTTSCKAVIVGDSGVGKTCLLARYISNKFDKDSISTACPTFVTKELEFSDINKKLNLDIWDTAGQELYKTLSKLFYKEAAIGILVYDISNKSSFESIKNYWYDELKNNGLDNMIFNLVGNKYDLYENEQVKEDEAREYANSINAGFYLTSAKYNNNVEELFVESGRKFLQPDYERKKLKSMNNDEENPVNMSHKLTKSKVNDRNKQHRQCC